MMKNISSSVEIPEDLIVEILSRVPAASLARFQSTCKQWNALFKDGGFSKKHSAIAPKQSLVIMLINFRVYSVRVDLHRIHNNVVKPKVTSQFSLKDPFSTNPTKEVDIQEVFHCEGLLLCNTMDNRLVVWNPCSGETRWIQPRNSYSHFHYHDYALGYDSKSSCYKILRMDLPEYEVYDLTSNSWRFVDGITDGYIPDCWSRSRKIYVNGNTYWLALGEHSKKFLMSFCFSTERFRSLSLPGDDSRPYDIDGLYLSVTREEQQLCLLATRRSEVSDVWMGTKIESTGAMSWTKFLTVSGANLGDQFGFLADQENKVVLYCNDYSWFSENFIIHIVGEDKYIEVDHLGAEFTKRSSTPFLLSYAPSLVQIQQGI